MAFDLLDTYDLQDFSADFRLMHFNSMQKGQPVLLRVCISNQKHILMPEVFNLSFGPPDLNSDTSVIDNVTITHDNIDKMLSTILLFAYTYSTINPNDYIGIDGSCNRRALLYFKKIKNNYTTLNGIFKIIAGVKYYVRLKRFSKPDSNLTENEQLLALVESLKNNLDMGDIQPLPEDITSDTEVVSLDKNYNYFIFKA